MDLEAQARAHGISSEGRLDLWEARRQGIAGKVAESKEAGMPPSLPKSPALLGEVAFRDASRTVAARAGGSVSDDPLRAFTAVFDVEPAGTATVGLKDMIEVAGHANTAGLNQPPGGPADRDASVVARLREAGLGIRGMLDMDSLAYGVTGLTSQVGPAVNALDAEVVAGGSSSGSAVAVAAGLVDCTLGTDAGGSNRIPAALNGVVGFKPTYGRIPNDGVRPLAPSLDHLGPLARTVGEVAALFSVMDPDTPAGHALEVAETDEIVIGLPTSYFFDELDETTRSEMDRLMATLRSHERVRLVDVELPGVEGSASSANFIMAREALQANADLLRRAPETIPEAVRLRLELGVLIPDAVYEESLEFQGRWQSSVDAAFAECHVLLTPTIAAHAPRIGQRTVDLTSVTIPVAAALTRLVSPFNLSGHPALSIPFVSEKSLIPVGVQLVGPRDLDAEFLAVAEAIEEMIGASRPTT